MGTQKTAYDKRNWLNKAFETAAINEIALDEVKLIAQFCLIHHTTKRTAKEILKLFEEAEVIKRVRGQILSPSLFKELYAEGEIKPCENEKQGELING